MSKSFDEAVLAYKYSSPNLSLFEQLFLNRFWDWFVNVYPLWLAPNLITLCGGTFCLVMYHLNWYLSPDGSGQAQPQLIYLAFSGMMLAYNTLDGTDGKQARRTKSGSALGELMDHGVDALVTGFVSFVVTDALGLGIDRPVVWAAIIGGQMAFYMSNMTLLHRGKQTFFPIDIMELQFVLITVLATAGLFGPKVWAETWIPIPAHPHVQSTVEFVANVLNVNDFVQQGQFQARLVVVIGAVGGTVQNFILYTYMSSTPYFTGNALSHPGCGKFQLVRQVIIILVYGALCASSVLFLGQIKSQRVRHQAFRAFLCTICFAFGDLMDRLLVMRVSHLPLPTMSPTLACVAIFAIAAAGVELHVVPTLPSLWAVALFAIVCHQLFFVWVSNKLAKVLGISVFTIKKLAQQ
ncbi:hypothetical protein BASA81_002319 [Batrachochytrium salamandrivorans]|nr:hypothetical protein BASA81_002319 [Batrachochytrium salamandrivorans]